MHYFETDGLHNCRFFCCLAAEFATSDIDIYFFRVTEEQFHELTESYQRAIQKAEEERRVVTYSYEELFGE